MVTGCVRTDFTAGEFTENILAYAGRSLKLIHLLFFVCLLDLLTMSLLNLMMLIYSE